MTTADTRPPVGNPVAYPAQYAEQLARRLADTARPLAARLATARGHLIEFAQAPALLQIYLNAKDEPAVTALLEKLDHLARCHLLPLDLFNALAATRTGPVIANVCGVETVHASPAAKALIDLHRVAVAELRRRAEAHHFHQHDGFPDKETAAHLIAAAGELEPLMREWEREAARLRAEAEVEFARAITASKDASPVAAVAKPPRRPSGNPNGDITREKSKGKPRRKKAEVAALECLDRHMPGEGEGFGPAHLRDWFLTAKWPDGMSKPKPAQGVLYRCRQLLDAAEIGVPGLEDTGGWRNLRQRLTKYRIDKRADG